MKERETKSLQEEDVRSLVRDQGRQTLSRAPQLKRRRPRPTAQPRHTLFRFRRPTLRAVSAALFAVLVFVGTAAGLLYNDLSHRAAKSELQVEQFAPQKENRPPADSFDGRAVNVLVLGTDSRVGEGNSRYGDDEDPSLRADVTIIAHISADRSRVQLVSIPRDTIVDIPSCVLKDGTETYPQTGQINWAMSIGSGYNEENLDAGVGCTWRTVEELTGIPIDGFVIFDFAGFEKIINALGGVEMCFEEDLYDQAAELDIPAGCHVLNGHDALAYARARKEIGNGSDISRIGRQQELMGRIFHTAQSQNLLTDFPKLYAFISESLDIIKTSSNFSRINTSMGLAYSLSAFSADGLQFVTMPLTEAPWDTNRVIPTWQADELWESIQKDQPLPPNIWITDAEGNVVFLEESSETKTNSTGSDGGFEGSDGSNDEYLRNSDSDGDGL